MFILPSVWMIAIDFGADWTKFEEKWTKFAAVPNIYYIFRLRLRINVTYYIPRIILSQNMTKTEKASYQRPLKFPLWYLQTGNLRDAKHTDI